MNIRQANNQDDWVRASELLIRVVEYLGKLGKPLWTKDQVSVAGLQRSYQLEELYFLFESQCVGVVFLQEQDPLFWPEITEQDSLYVHKLAIAPSFFGIGSLAMKAVIQEAERRGCRWVRLDCDDRPELHRFYLGNGFELVDFKNVDAFEVARYQLPVNPG